MKRLLLYVVVCFVRWFVTRAIIFFFFFLNREKRPLQVAISVCVSHLALCMDSSFNKESKGLVVSMMMDDCGCSRGELTRRKREKKKTTWVSLLLTEVGLDFASS